ncbi:thioredoxin family protein [Pseudonocardia sp. CA-107938]|uniref:thioredoxin family protein n=1 Tax=Pseudonocardia sp. CA-107938 TaxID=3240021 RepID=UPI003D90033D
MSFWGAVGLGVAVAVTVVVALLLRARDGRVRAGGGHTGGWALAERPPAAPDRVLLLQLSSPVCTPCRQTAAVLDELTGRTPGLVHVELDVADRPDVARELGVMRTPTVVAFDRGGAELLRVSGVPRSTDLLSGLESALSG